MTVIASITINKIPILIGDLIISGPEDTNNKLHLPTIGETKNLFPHGSKISPKSLFQKIAILNDNLVVAWSGRMLDAKIIICDLFRQAQNKQFWSFEDLSRFFADYDMESGKEVGIIGFSNDGIGIFSWGYGISEKTQLTKYGLIRYSGSGAKDLLSYLDNFDIAPASRKTNPLETAIGTILPIANFMNGMEVVNPINLFQQYGGGYEIASFINKKFKKIDDITYLLWFGKQNKDLSWGLSIPKVVIKYYYIDDLLIIRRFETSNKKNKLSSIMKEEIYAISPIYNQINLTNLKKIELQSFNSRFICSCIFLEDINGNPQVLSRINYSNQETNPIKFIENDNSKIEMHFKSDFVTSIFESIPKL